MMWPDHPHMCQGFLTWLERSAILVQVEVCRKGQTLNLQMCPRRMVAQSIDC